MLTAHRLWVMALNEGHRVHRLGVAERWLAQRVAGAIEWLVATRRIPSVGAHGALPKGRDMIEIAGDESLRVPA
ncbi:MAG: hypothetical protein GKR94_28535 [Gammaproteobacteria bacterium]|nr:hypothetical protein [Gammaproteobacteria bacterium]